MRKNTHMDKGIVMLNIERLDYILNELQSKRAVSVDCLAKKYFVSKSTIRRDLSQLEREGYIRRTYGGAVLSDQQNNETPFDVRKMENHLSKDIIGSLAARLVKDDMFICLDSSTTAMNLVRYLKSKNNLRVITTSAQTALNCLDMLNAQIYCTGGWMHSYTRGFIGEAARQRITNFNTDILFFSSRSVSLEAGITDINEEEIALRQEVLKKCKKAVFLCDKTKLNQTSSTFVCEFNQIDYFITDEKPDDNWIEALKNAKVNLIYPGHSVTGQH
jgi:DeoR/GlpR family transcriptional regulator of sugar metabolism